MRLRFSITLLAALCFAAACEPPVDAALLHIDGLGTERLEPGATVEITGRGFPPGRLGTVRFEGLSHRPGEHPLRVEAEMDARAVAEGRMVLGCTREMVEALGGRGTFVGALRVEFRGSDGATVSGEVAPLTLATRPGGLGAASTMLRRERRGQALLLELGISAREDEAAEPGVTIESFSPGSLADLAGMQKGDRIIALGPMRVDDLGDLIPPPGAPTVELAMRRSHVSQPVRAIVALGQTPAGPRPRALYGATAAVGLSFLLFFLLSPAARITSRVFGALTARGPSIAETLFAIRPVPPDAPLLRRVARLTWLVIGALAVLVAFGVLPFMARVLPGAVDAGVVVTVAIGLSGAVRAAFDADEAITARLAGVLGALAMSAPALVAVAAVALPLGSFHIEALSAAQGGAPFEWAGLSTLPGLFGLPAALISLLIVPLAPKSGATASVLDRVRLFLGASILTIVFLGGFRLPFFAGDPLVAAPAIRVAAALFFVFKAVVVVIVASRLRRAVSRPVVLATTSAFFSVLAAGAFAAEMVLPISPPPADVVGPVVLAVMLIVSAVGLYGSRERRLEEHDAGVALFS